MTLFNLTKLFGDKTEEIPYADMLGCSSPYSNIINSNQYYNGLNALSAQQQTATQGLMQQHMNMQAQQQYQMYNQIYGQSQTLDTIKRKPHEVRIEFSPKVNPQILNDKLVELGIDFEMFPCDEAQGYGYRPVSKTCVNTSEADGHLIRLVLDMFEIENYYYVKKG